MPLTNSLSNQATHFSPFSGRFWSVGVPIRNIADYSPFGVTLDGRTIQTDFYRRGFNGMEKDDEVSGNGNSYTTEFRQYDARVGRWLSLDPLMVKFPWQSPYVAFDDLPTIVIDPSGESGIVVIDKKTKTITIKSNNYYFSPGFTTIRKADRLIAAQHAQNIQDTWNNANAVRVIDGVEYKVQFEVKGKAIGFLRGSIGYFMKEYFFKKGKNNFIRVGSVYSTNSNIGGSTQRLTMNDWKDLEKQTDSHEQGHFWGWFDQKRIIIQIKEMRAFINMEQMKTDHLELCKTEINWMRMIGTKEKQLKKM